MAVGANRPVAWQYGSLVVPNRSLLKWMTDRNVIGGKCGMDRPQAARRVCTITVDTESVSIDGHSFACVRRDVSGHQQGNSLLGGCRGTVDHCVLMAAGEETTAGGIAAIGKGLCSNLQALCLGNCCQSAAGGGKQHEVGPVTGQTAAHRCRQILIITDLMVEGPVQLDVS